MLIQEWEVKVRQAGSLCAYGLQYQIPQPKLPVLDMVGKNKQEARMATDVTHDRAASGATHV